MYISKIKIHCIDSISQLVKCVPKMLCGQTWGRVRPQLHSSRWHWACGGGRVWLDRWHPPTAPHGHAFCLLQKSQHQSRSHFCRVINGCPVGSTPLGNCPLIGWPQHWAPPPMCDQDPEEFFGGTLTSSEGGGSQPLLVFPDGLPPRCASRRAGGWPRPSGAPGPGARRRTPSGGPPSG